MQDKRLKSATALILVIAVFTASAPFISYAQNISPDTDPSKCAVDLALDTIMDKALGFISNQISSAIKHIPVVGSFLGGGDTQEVKETGFRDLFRKEAIKACLKSIKDNIIKIAFYRFQKRLLDKITDDTIAWINGEAPRGSPQFITDFKGYIKEAADEAAGDTLIELGAGDLCYGGAFRFNINLQLKQPYPFREQVSCTLSRVIENASTFRNNFSEGGWLGYYEVLKPQNNQYGLAYMTYDEYQRRKAEEESKRLSEFGASSGYATTEQCVEWRLMGVVDGLEQEIEGPNLNADAPDPKNPPEYNPSRDGPVPASYVTLDTSVAPYWKCAKKQNTMPYTAKEALTNRALTSDTDYLINAQDLSPYVSSIFDAAVNRLIKTGIDGLLDRSKKIFSDSGTGRPATPRTSPLGTDPFETNNQELTASLSNSVDSLISKAEQSQENINLLVMQIKATGDLITKGTTTQELLSCQKTRTPNDPVISSNGCASTNTTITQVNDLLLELPGIQQSNSEMTAIISDARNTKANASNNESTLISLTSTLNFYIESMNSNVRTLTTLKEQLQTIINNFGTEVVTCKNQSAAYSCSEQSVILSSPVSTGSGSATTSESIAPYAIHSEAVNPEQ